MVNPVYTGIHQLAAKNGSSTILHNVAIQRNHAHFVTENEVRFIRRNNFSSDALLQLSAKLLSIRSYIVAE